MDVSLRTSPGSVAGHFEGMRESPAYVDQVAGKLGTHPRPLRRFPLKVSTVVAAAFWFQAGVTVCLVHAQRTAKEAKKGGGGGVTRSS